MSSPGRRGRWRSWWLWIARPWRSPAVALALLGALALPPLLLASGPMFERSASDAIATDLVAELEPGPAGLVVSAVVGLGDPGLDALGAEVERQLESVDALGAPLRTAISENTTAVPAGTEPGSRRIARVLARDGAAEAVELVAGDRDPSGVLVPANLAADIGVAPGDEIRLGGAAPVTVSGVYRDLWTEPLDEYWSDAPGDIVPRFQRVFNAPSFELVIASDAVLGELGPSGRARWDAALEDRPTTWLGLQALVDEYARVDRTLVRPGPLLDAYRAIAIEPNAPPSSFTALTEAEDRASALIADLERPVRATTIGGVVTGLVLSSLGAIVLVRRHRRDHRLLAADGDAAWRFVGRAAAQGAPAAAAGAVVGVAAAWLLIDALGPSGTADLSVVPWSQVAAVSLLALVLSSIATAALAVRLTDALHVSVGGLRTTWLSILFGTVVAMWVAVGQDDRRGVDALVVAFPLVGIVAGVLAVTLLLRWALRAVRHTGSRLPTPAFLAWRALTASEDGALGLTAAVGIAAGLAVLSTGFVDSIDRAIELKAVTAIGSTSRLDTVDRIEQADLPPESTVIRSLTTRIDGRTVDVLAIDPATFEAAVDLPSAFGRSAEDVVDALASPEAGDDVPEGSVPALAIDRYGVPARSEFGLQRVFPYHLVGTMRSFPLASSTHATIVVRADVLDEIAIARWQRDQELVGQTDRLAAEALGEPIGFESPLEGYGNTVVSRQPPEVLQQLADTAGWRVPEVRSIADQTGDVASRSTRWAFDHLGILGVVGAVVALASLALYLAERRRDREVATVMSEQMGIPRSVNVVAAVVELLGLVAVAVAAGVAAAVITARHVFPSFEPDPTAPPAVGLTIDRTGVAAFLALTAVVVSALAALAQRRASAARRAEVLRG